MSTQLNKGTPVSNLHYTSSIRLGVEPDYSTLASFQSYNTELTKARDLDRYRTGWSDKTNIYDPSRVVSPQNYFGIRYGRYIDPTIRYAPAGLDGVNSRPISGVSFTKKIVARFQPL